MAVAPAQDPAAPPPAAVRAAAPTGLPPIPLPYERARIEGYPREFSVCSGELLGLCISSELPRYDVEIKNATTDRIHHTALDIAGSRLEMAVDAAEHGCDWPVSIEVPISRDWPSGIYVARLTGRASADEVSPVSTGEVRFCVRPVVPGWSSGVLLLHPECTTQAYNAWGGSSFYQSGEGTSRPLVAFDRPIDPRSPAAQQWSPALLRWLEARGRLVELASDRDLHREPDLLDPYDLLIVEGHSEYWSREMRDAVDRFVGDGGNLLVLGGNTCFLQVRFERDARTMRCHKDPLADAYYASSDPAQRRLVSTAYDVHPVFDPPDRTIGVGFRNAQWATPWGLSCFPGPFGGVVPCFPYEQGYGYYRLHEPRHFAFAGLALGAGEIFGIESVRFGQQSYSLIAVSGECDGAPLELTSSGLVASTRSGAPRNATILATAPAQEGFVTFSMHRDLGTVVNVGSSNFATLPLGGIPGYRLACIESITERLLDELGRERRSLVANGGFERWSDGVPAGFSVEGRVERRDRWISGAHSLAVPARERARLAVPLPEHSRATMLGISVFARGARSGARLRIEERPGGIARAECALQTDASEHAWHELLLPPDLRASLVLDVPAGDADLVLDHLEILPLDAAGSMRALPPISNGRVALGPCAGGERYLVAGHSGPATGGLDVAIREVGASGAPLAARRLEPGPFAWVFDVPRRGTYAELELTFPGSSAPGPGSPGDLRLLALHAASAPPPPWIPEGSFETALDETWTIEPGRSRIDREEAAAGRGCLTIDASSMRVTAHRALPPSQWKDGEIAVLSCWSRASAAGSRLALIAAGAEIAAMDLAAQPSWSAAAEELALPSSAGRDLELRLDVPEGVALSIDELRLQSLEEILGDDLVSNGDFEIAPTPAEERRGTAWAHQVPSWIVSAPQRVCLTTEHAAHGARSLELDGRSEPAWAYRYVCEVLPTDRPWRLRAKARAEGSGSFSFTLQAIVPSTAKIVLVETARTRTSDAWETLSIALPRARFTGAARHEALRLLLRCEAVACRAYVDQITLETDAP